MTRVRNNFVTRKRHKKILSITKGFVGSHSKLFRIANQQMMRSLRYAFFDRRKKKNQNKRVWIVRINAASRHYETRYSEVMNYLRKIKININKLVLSEIAHNNKVNFKKIIKHK